ncbi:uncharacterized protein LOC134232074 [Saccostrea cucullata]|uniref:uncharacterized protein LOC134232074 n=1 Tax=Saccostrea cuccullata TaxID=36930 RepID=UPI002ED5EE60
MNSIDASLLQLVGLCFKIRQEDKLSEEHLKLVDSITSQVQQDVKVIREHHHEIELKLSATKKEEAILKRKLHESEREIQKLKEKNRKLESNSADLKEKCRELESELDTSWIEDVDISATGVTEEVESSQALNSKGVVDINTPVVTQMETAKDDSKM